MRLFNQSNLKYANMLAMLLVLIAVTGITAVFNSPFIHAHLQQTAFLTSWGFLVDFLHYPGGLSDYISLFVAQFFQFNLAGSILIVLFVFFQGWILGKILQRVMEETRLKFLSYGLLILFGTLVFTDFRYPFYASVRLLIGILILFLLSKDFVYNSFFRITTLVFSFLLLFYIAGGAVYWVVSGSYLIILIWKKNKRYFLAEMIAVIILALVVPWASFHFIFPLGFTDMVSITTNKPPAMLTYSEGFPVWIYYTLIPVLLIILPVLDHLLPSSAGGKLLKGDEEKGKIRLNWLISAVQWIFILLLGTFLFDHYIDREKRTQLFIEYLADNGRWKEVIKESRKIRKFDVRINFQVDRAMANLGVMAENLYDYPQVQGSNGMFLDATLAENGSMPTSDLYFDLGLMSESQHWAFETQTLLPEGPRSLKRIVQISLVKRNYTIAREFLDVLDQNMLCHGWVKKYRTFLADTNLIDKDPLLCSKRKLDASAQALNTDPETNLIILLQANDHNRIAFEYLMEYYLLNKELGKFIAYLPKVTTFGYKKLPRSFEEALMIYLVSSKEQPEGISMEMVSQECIGQFKKLNAILNSHGRSPAQAKPYIGKEFFNTYWYYFLYLQPKVTESLSKTGPVK